MLKNWVDHYYEDVEEDIELEETMTSFVTKCMDEHKAVMKAGQQVLNLLARQVCGLLLVSASLRMKPKATDWNKRQLLPLRSLFACSVAFSCFMHLCL